MDKQTMATSDNFNPFNPQYLTPGGPQSPGIPSWLPAAGYRPPLASAFSSPPAPGPLSIPPAQPPIFLSPPDPAGAAPAQPGSALGNIGQSLASGINNHALTLMALGAGIAQGGVGQGLASAATAAQAERSLQAQQFNFLQTYKALTDAGVPAEEARAAVTNPSMMRAVAVKYLGSRSQNAAPGAPAAPASAGASNASPPPASAANSLGPNVQGNATNMMLASARAPALPPNVTPGASYSPARNMWRDHGGNRFDLQGKTVA
jgi:hypothetical protein